MPEEAMVEAVPKCEAGEAVMEAVPKRRVGKARRERRMRSKGSAREARTSEIAKVRACAYGAEMHPATHSASHGMHPHSSATHAAGVPTKAAATATTPRECRRRKSKRRAKRARDETTEKLVVHPILHQNCCDATVASSEHEASLTCSTTSND
jgi:hypothetical protein